MSCGRANKNTWMKQDMKFWLPFDNTQRINCSIRVRKNYKKKKAFISCIMPVCPSHETIRLLLDGFFWQFIRWNFTKIYQYNSVLVNNGHITLRPKCVFGSTLLSLSPTTFTRAHWGCHGNEAMVIPSINFTAVHDLDRRCHPNLTT
jgi:hypothetical protein